MNRNATRFFLWLFIIVLLEFFGDPTINSARSNSNAPDSEWKKRQVQEIHLVQSTIHEWISAWRKKNFDAYISYYGSDFRSGETDYNGWRRKKTGIFQRPGAVMIEMSDLWFFIEGKRAIASFKQAYETTSHSDTGKKHLKLVKSDGDWKIVSEEWEPLSQ